MKKDYKGIAEEEILAQLCIYCIRRSLNIDDEYTPLLFLGWGEYTSGISLQMFRFRQLKNVVSQADFITNKDAFLTNLSTDSSIDIELFAKTMKRDMLEKTILEPQDMAGEELNYNAIIALAANLSYYLDLKKKKSSDLISKNLSFVLILEIDLDELEEYTTEVLNSSNINKNQKLYIQKGLHLFKGLYLSENCTKYREEDQISKKYFREIYRRIYTDMTKDPKI